LVALIYPAEFCGIFIAVSFAIITTSLNKDGHKIRATT